MGARLPVVEHGMEAQERIRALRKSCAPLYEAALASGNHAVMAETKALAETLRVAGVQAKRLTGYAESACPDGLTLFGHGRAA